MTENLQKAYDAYQQALVNLRDPKDPMLWYGIGILYDRYGSYDYAEEAFSQVMQIQPDFDKANEIYFRLGIIYKQQQKYPQSLEVSTHPRIVGSQLTHPDPAVLQIHCQLASRPSHPGRHLVPDWPRPRAAKRRTSPPDSQLTTQLTQPNNFIV